MSGTGRGCSAPACSVSKFNGTLLAAVRYHESCYSDADAVGCTSDTIRGYTQCFYCGGELQTEVKKNYVSWLLWSQVCRDLTATPHAASATRAVSAASILAIRFAARCSSVPPASKPAQRLLHRRCMSHLTSYSCTLFVEMG